MTPSRAVEVSSEKIGSQVFLEMAEANDWSVKDSVEPDPPRRTACLVRWSHNSNFVAELCSPEGASCVEAK